MINREGLPRGVPFALARAERAAKVAKRALATAGWLIVVGCSLPFIGAAALASSDQVVGGAFLGIYIGMPAVGVGLLMLIFALPFYVITKREYRETYERAHLPSDDHSLEANEAQWRNLLAARSRGDRSGGSR